MPKDLLKNKILFKKYQLLSKIGKGSFGFVYSARNLKNNKKVAVKLEDRASKYHLLERESNFLSILKGVGIPEIMSYGLNNKYYIMVQELLGENLGDIMSKLRNSQFNIVDVSMIAIQVLDRIEFVHSKNVVHRDMKPENFLFGLEDKSFLYLIDFGIARKYRSSRTGKHIKYSLTGKLFGTLKFLSYNATRGVQQTRRDDLESIGYMLVYLAGKELPWQKYSIHGPKAKTSYENILELKRITKPESYCKCLPHEFVEYINYCHKLHFEQDPNYEYLKNLFRSILNHSNKINDLKFSWWNQLNVISQKDILNKTEDDVKSLNKEKYTNLLKRKQSPQIRLYHAIRQTLSNDFSKNKNIIIEKTSTKNSNLKKIIHQKGKSFDYANILNSFYSNVSKDGGSNDSVKVQYDVDIEEIGKENSKENKNIQKNNNIDYLKNNINNKNKGNLFSYNNKLQKIIKINKIPKKIYKNVNLSLDLDKKFVIDKNIKNNDEQSKSHSLNKKLIINVLNSENEKEQKRMETLGKIYSNIINRIMNQIKKWEIKIINRRAYKKYKKIPNKTNKNVFLLNDINTNNISLLNERQHFRQLSNQINDKLSMNNNIFITNNNINNLEQNQLRKIQLSNKRIVNNNYLNTKIKLNNRGSQSPNFADKRVIIINNNINSYNKNDNNIYTPHKYISIKERNRQQNSFQINLNFNNFNKINPIITDTRKNSSIDNYLLKRKINKKNNKVLNTNIFNSANSYQQNYNCENSYNSFNKSKGINYINLPKGHVINKSDDLINESNKPKIKIHNYTSVINAKQFPKNNNHIKGKLIQDFNKLKINPSLKRLTKKNIQMMKTNNNYTNLNKKQINRNNDQLLIRKLNNYLIPNSFPSKKNLSPDTYLRNLNRNHKQNYSNQNTDFISNEIDGNNFALLVSKSNVNVREEIIKKRRRKQLNNNNYSNSQDSKIYRYIPNCMDNIY